jgi:hypothetical protein
MNIDALYERFTKRRETQQVMEEVLALFLETEKPVGSILVEQKGMTLTWDGIPDIPISEIPWSDVKTVEGGADIAGPQRQQLMQFLDDIEGDDLKDKIEGLAKFYEADASALLEKTKDMNAKEKISAAIGYLTFFKTLTKIIAHFNASSAGFSFEAFLGVLLGGAQIATGEGTIADLTAKVGGQDVPISLKLYTEGSLKVGGSFTDLVNDLRKYEIMQYVAVTKDLNDEKTEGTLTFYRFNFTLDNIANILIKSGLHNPDLIKLPKGFIDEPEGFADIEIPAPPKTEEVVKLYHDRVKELGAKSGIAMDILEKAVKLVGLPEDTSQLEGQKRFGRDDLMKREMGGKVYQSKPINLALKMGLLDEVPPPYKALGTSKKPAAVAAREEWMATYGERIVLALRIYNEVVGAAYNDVTELTNANIKARQELIKRGGGQYDKRKGAAGAQESVDKYNALSPELKKKALLLSHGYVNTDKFDITEPRVLTIQAAADPYPVFPAGQTEVKLGSIEVGQEQVVTLMKKVSEIIDTSVFEIFEDLKTLTTNIQAYFGNGLQDDKQANTAIGASRSIGTKTAALTDDGGQQADDGLADEFSLEE